MDNDELIYSEYKLYAEQKENFIDRNFKTNKFYMISVLVLIYSLIFTGNVIFMDRISATLVVSMLGVAVCSLWWMNVDTYNTLIKVKFSDVLEKIEEKLPVRPFTDEFKGIKEFREKKVFMFSDIQKFIAACSTLFFFAIAVSEFAPIVAKIIDKIIVAVKIKGGI